MKRTILFLLLLMVLTTTGYSSDSLTVIGKIVDQDGIGVENAVVISEEKIKTVTNSKGDYSITVPKDYVGIDNFDVDLTNKHDYTVRIFNLIGQQIFEKDCYNSFIQNFQWNGKNRDGKTVSSGLYFSILKINNKVILKSKITLLGNTILNKRPFINYNSQQVNNEWKILDKTTSYNTIYFDLQGENFTKINGLGVNISDYNSDNVYEAEDIQVNTYEIGTVTDMDGNVYKTVKIGNQWWMAENLRVTHYRNGDPIGYVEDKNIWRLADVDKVGAYCFYNNDTSYISKNGYLYNWYATADDRNIAPEGWRIPSSTDWTVLINYLGEHAGEKLKSIDGWENWNDEYNCTDEFGFNGYPGGYRNDAGDFKNIFQVAGYWSLSECDKNNAIRTFLYYLNSLLKQHYAYKRDGFAVRCIKGEIDPEDEKPIGALFIYKLDENSNTYIFDASSCEDKEDNNEQLQVCWNWNNDYFSNKIFNNWDTPFSTEKIVTREYSDDEDVSVTMMVIDSNMNSDTVTVEFNTSDIPADLKFSEVTDIIHTKQSK